MGKPSIKPGDTKAYATPGIVQLKPAKDTLEISIGVVTLFLSEKEAWQLYNSLGHYAHQVWGDQTYHWSAD